MSIVQTKASTNNVIEYWGLIYNYNEHTQTLYDNFKNVTSGFISVYIYVTQHEYIVCS